MSLSNRTVAIFLLSFTLLFVGCGSPAGSNPSPVDSGAQTAALEKAKEWQDKKIYALAEMEARKAGTGPEARALLFESLRGQSDDESKQSEAETLAAELAKGTDASAQAAQEFLTRRERLKELETLRAAVEKPGADKAKLIEAFPKEKRGVDYHAYAFESLSADPASASKDSPAFAHAAAYLAITSEGPTAERAKTFLAAIKEAEGQAKTPTEAVKLALADSTGEAEVLKGVKILSTKETIHGDLGRVDAKVEFTNPYTKKKQTAQILLACSKRKEGWRVNWNKSEYLGLYPRLGQPQHNLSPAGVAGIASAEESLEALDKKLQLVPADPLYAVTVELQEKLKAQGVEQPDVEPVINIYRAKESDLVVIEPGTMHQRLVVFDPHYRLSSGLGVGNTLADFLESHTPQRPERASSVSGSGVLTMGVITSKGKLDIYSVPLIPKTGDKKILTVYLQGDGYSPVDEVRDHRVVGLAYLGK